jgi:xanthine dehydrogenase YagT iron-sulfur-binding subunit
MGAGNSFARDADITLHVDGRPRQLTVDTRMTLLDGARVTPAAGLGRGEELHPVAEAFLDEDAFQCGYCTPRQVCSAVGMLDEWRAGAPSAVTADGAAGDNGGRAVELTDEEIRERLAGNLCRCGAYVNIVDAVRSAAGAPAGGAR